MFLVCIVIAVLFWFLIVLTKDYTRVVPFKIVYENAPSGKVISSELPDSIAFEINASGLALLRLDINGDEKQVSLDLSHAIYNAETDKYVTSTYPCIEALSLKYKKIKFIKAGVDKISMSVSKRVSKKIPVKIDALLSYAPQYQLNGIVTTSPQYVVINGDSASLAQIEEIRTEPIMIKNLKSTLAKLVKLNTQALGSRINVHPLNVQLNIPVDKYTEATIVVPIKPENIPSYMKVKLIPSEVRVTYKVGVKDFEKIKADDFIIKADFKSGKIANENRIKLLIVKAPPFVRNTRLEIEKVDFILKRY